MKLKSIHLIKMTSGNEDLNCIHSYATTLKHVLHSHGHCTHWKECAVNCMISLSICSLLGGMQGRESYILYVFINASTIILTL
jgi:hypothetical protein